MNSVRLSPIRGLLPLSLDQHELPNQPPASEPVPPTADASLPPWNLPKDAPPPAIAPFDAAQARKHREAWGKHLRVPVEQTNSLGLKFAIIPPGEFDMGISPAQVEAIRADLLKVAPADLVAFDKTVLRKDAPRSDR